MKISVFLATALAALTITSSAQAHFQLVYTPDVNVSKAGDMPFKLIFWHPFENGPAMDMGQPEDFFVVHKGKKTDLLSKLKPITFHGAENSAKAYEVSVPVRTAGDYILALTPAPYHDETEDIYIQQFTKSFVNKNGMPTDWDQPLGLAAEIVPFVKPTAIPTGSTFTGQVLGDGKPAANAEIEVEYIAAEPDMTANKPGPVAASPMAGGTMVVHTDANGMFTYGLPKAGFWGFAALGVGPKKDLNGKELSQDAVIWVHVEDLK